MTNEGNEGPLCLNADLFLAWIANEGSVLIPALIAAGVASYETSEGEKMNPIGPQKGEWAQGEYSGGLHTAPEARAIMHYIARAMGEDLGRQVEALETGYDAGYTTLALARAGCKVVGVDDLSEYGVVDSGARARLAPFPDVTLVEGDALAFLRAAENESYDLIFVDDDHAPTHVREEAREVRRVLRQGGIAFFHDTIGMGLWEVAAGELEGWEMVNLPAVSPVLGRDFGLGMFRKPL